MPKSFYSKNKDRINTYLRRYHKKGFYFNLPENIIELLEVKPRYATERQKNAISNIKTSNLMKYADKISNEYGEVLDYVKEPSPISKSVFIDYYFNELKKYRNGAGYDYLNNFVHALLTTRTENQVGEMLEKGFSNGLLLNYKISYSIEESEMYISEMLDYLPDLGETERLEFIETLDLVDYSGYYD